MTADAVGDRTEAVRDRYRATLGSVPSGVEDRLRIAGTFDRLRTEEALAALRQLVLADSPLGARVQQLVHVGQLLSLGRAEPARLHARGALHVGASLADLVGVAETALITTGVPAYALGIEIIAELLREQDERDAQDAQGAGEAAGSAG
ncbi:hypothetical protein GCM10009665_38510 [Kitasatospora nipponensis]|uniref:Carboxymuconolactone decarboxylase-like domain-containing protein n=1 Tax=Kitasatospora nipponensis TaxID=258049 RepID=A0ABN1WF75_9ACTN